MLREYAFIWRGLFIAIDLSISAAVFLGVYWLRFQPAVDVWFKEHPERPSLEAYLQALPAIYIILFFTNNFFRLYHPRRVSSFLQEFVDIWKSNTIAILLLGTFFFLNRNYSYSRSIAGIFLFLNPMAVFSFRLAIRTVLRWLRSRGYNLRTVLIVGTGRPAQALLHRLKKNPWTGMRVAGLVALSPEKVGKFIHGVPVVGTTDEIQEIVERFEVNQAYLALPLQKKLLIERLIHELADSFVAIRMIPDLGYLLNNRNTSDFDGLSIVNLWENHLSGWNAFAKRALDLGFALLAVAALFPLFLLIGLSIHLTDRGPIFYRQKRMGHDGRIFSMLKFRTMRVGSESDAGFTQPDDERCTVPGSILRRTSLDELPQLFNVILGQMSLVGPRPERPVFIEAFKRTMPEYMLRHKAKAGMTGWAQINGWRGDSSLKKRLQYDLYYLHNWSLWFDLKILLMTVFRGWTHKNAY